ncbi:hypothetical protein ACH4TX_27095, partial [Streptomyces sp. NPDC021098]|uniref:hypothetical protein n=1 Tax=unclassified Streptomyces TaxID=2593676 RepID=UPI0037BD42CB
MSTSFAASPSSRRSNALASPPAAASCPAWLLSYDASTLYAASRRSSCGGTHVLARQFRLDQQVVGSGVPLTDAQWARIEPLLPDR